MTIPVTGALIVIIGLCFFFFSPALLYAAMIVSIPFSATAVINVGSGDDEKGVAVWLFLGLLWLVRETLSGVPPWHQPGWFLSRRARYGLLAFLGSVIVSLSVPLVLNGTAWVPEYIINSNQTVPLRFGMYNVTQVGYLAFGVLLAIFVAAENCDSTKLFYTFKLYVCSCAFAAAWGLFELWCDLSGHAYPAYIFNSNASESALGYLEVLKLSEGTLTRISSVALEPSVLAEELLLAFVILLVCIGFRRPLLGMKWDYAVLVLITSTLLASTSSTAYVGLVMAVAVAAIALARAGKPWKIYAFIAAIALTIATVVLLEIPFLGQMVDMLLFSKFEAGSGLERVYSNQLAVQDFLRYPLLGAGWHNVDCRDLIFLILANTGLLGLIAFGVFAVPVLRSLWMATKKTKLAAVVSLSAISLTLLLSEVAGLTYAAGYVWLFFGVAAGAVIAAQRESSVPVVARLKKT